MWFALHWAPSGLLADTQSDGARVPCDRGQPLCTRKNVCAEDKMTRLQHCALVALSIIAFGTTLFSISHAVVDSPSCTGIELHIPPRPEDPLVFDTTGREYYTDDEFGLAGECASELAAKLPRARVYYNSTSRQLQENIFTGFGAFVALAIQDVVASAVVQVQLSRLPEGCHLPKQSCFDAYLHCMAWVPGGMCRYVSCRTTADPDNSEELWQHALQLSSAGRFCFANGLFMFQVFRRGHELENNHVTPLFNWQRP
jgi:hypothetical protein